MGWIKDYSHNVSLRNLTQTCIGFMCMYKYIYINIKTYVYIYIHTYIYIYMCVYVYILCLLVEHGRDDYICNRGVYGKLCFRVNVFLYFSRYVNSSGFRSWAWEWCVVFFLPNPKIERNPLRNPGTLGNIKRNQKRNFVFSGRYSWVDWPSIFEVLSSIWFYWCSMEKWCTHFCSEIGSNENRMVWIIVKSKTTCCKIYVICNIRTYIGHVQKKEIYRIYWNDCSWPCTPRNLQISSVCVYI